MPVRARRLAAVIALGATLGPAAACKPDKPDVQAARFEAAKDRAEAAKRAVQDGREGLEAALDLPPELATLEVARIGEGKLTLSDVVRHIESQPRHMRARFATKGQREALLQDLVHLEVLARQAKADGLDASPRVRFATKRAMVQELLSRRAEEELGLSELPESDLKAYYDANQAQFISPERRRAATLVLRGDESMAPIELRLRAALRDANGLDEQVFGDFVEEHSVGLQTRGQRGDLGWFGADGKNAEGQVRVEDRIAEAVFGLAEPGAISDRLTLDSGYVALVQLTGVEPARSLSFEEARLEIQESLLRVRRAEARQGYLERLVADADVKVDEAALAKLEAIYAEREVQGVVAPGGGEAPARAEAPAAQAPAAQATTAPRKSGDPSPEALGDTPPPTPKPVLNPRLLRQGLVPRAGGKAARNARGLGVMDPKDAPGAMRLGVEEVQEKMREDKEARERRARETGEPPTPAAPAAPAKEASP